MMVISLKLYIQYWLDMKLFQVMVYVGLILI